MYNLSDIEIESLKKAINAITPMSDFDFEILLPLLQKRSIKKGDYILKEGEISKTIFFLINGLVRMYFIDFEGNDISYRFTSTNRFFVDYQSLLTQQPSHYFLQALQNTTMLVINYEDVLHTYQISPAWSNFGRIWSEHVYLQLNERVEMLLLMKPEERYLHLLNEQPYLFNEVSQIHLSSYLGIKPESLSRIRKRILQNNS